MSNITPLSSGSLNGQTLTIELVEPGNDLPNAGRGQVASEANDHQPRHLRQGGSRHDAGFVQRCRRIGRPSCVEKAVNAAEALEDARRVRRETEARQAEVDALAAQLAAHLIWLQENPDAVWKAITRE
jgi:hypothetical protein